MEAVSFVENSRLLFFSGSKYGWFKASVAVKRYFGFIRSKALMKESPFCSIFPKYFLSIGSRV